MDVGESGCRQFVGKVSSWVTEYDQQIRLLQKSMITSISLSMRARGKLMFCNHSMKPANKPSNGQMRLGSQKTTCFKS